MLILRKTERGLTAEINGHICSISPTSDGMMQLLNLLDWNGNRAALLEGLLASEEVNQYKNFLTQAICCRNNNDAQKLVATWTPIFAAFENRALAKTAHSEIDLVIKRCQPPAPSRFANLIGDL